MLSRPGRWWKWIRKWLRLLSPTGQLAYQMLHILEYIVCFFVIWSRHLWASLQEDDAAVVWRRLQSHHPDLQPHQSRLVPENARVSGCVTRYLDVWGSLMENECVNLPSGCGWAPCFHGYRRAAARPQASRRPFLRGTCWNTWDRTELQSSRSGSSESKSTTCQRPGGDEVHTLLVHTGSHRLEGIETLALTLVGAC